MSGTPAAVTVAEATPEVTSKAPLKTAPPQESLELRDRPWSDPMETLRKGLRLISPRVGILRELGSTIHFPGDPVCHVLGNKVCDTSRFTQQVKHPDRSGSAGPSLERALAAAVGEAVERYCMRFYDYDELVFGTYEELSSERGGDLAMVHPEQIRLHTEEQIKEKGGRKSRGGFARRAVLREDTPVNWAWAYSLTHRSWKLVPAHMVYLPYKTLPEEARTGWNSSTGLAAGNTLEEAILTGTLEWIERDAFVLCWLNRHIPRRIRVDDPALEERLRRDYQVDHPEVELRLFDIALDIRVPVTLVWMRRPMEFGPGNFVGAACRTSYAAALDKSLTELAQCVPCARYTLKQHASWEPASDFSDISSFEKHSILYNKRPELVGDAFEFCREVGDEVAFSELEDPATGSALGDLQAVVDELDRHGHEVLVTELTTEDVREVGLHAVRVVVPGLENMHGNHNWPCLGVDRLTEVPKRLGWETGDLNPYPHPFP